MTTANIISNQHSIYGSSIGERYTPDYAKRFEKAVEQIERALDLSMPRVGPTVTLSPAAWPVGTSFEDCSE